MFSQRIRATYLCVALSAGVGGVSSCLDRPVVPSDPVTSNQFVDLTTQRNVDKIDLLFMIDNSGSMSDKQEILKLAVPQLLGRLVSPLCHDAQGRSVTSEGGVCPEGFTLEYDPVDDIHIGVISSSLGTPNTTACAPELVEHADDAAHLIGLRRTAADGSPLNTYQGLGFLAWDPKGKKLGHGLPPGESNPEVLVRNFQQLVEATSEEGCGYEASLEAWYRFLVDPAPPARWVVENEVARPEGVDNELLEQRRQFLRPDSLLAIIMLSDENDCSLDFRGDGWMLANSARRSTGSSWHMPRGTTACASDTTSVCCRPCGDEPGGPPQGCEPTTTDPACAKASQHDESSDPRNLRCFDQKRRFGVERLHPVERYVNALTSATVRANDGTEHPNPLFTDLNTGLAATRSPDLVFLAGIVGVPWQAIATSDSFGPGSEQTLRYQSAADLLAKDVWSLIAGNPEQAIPPTDPLMWESVAPRQGTSLDNIPLAPPEAGLLENPINGHEYYPLNQADLQYACIFPLQPPVTCEPEDTSCDCHDSQQTLTPLCQQSDGQYSNTQRFAKAYPGLRQLQVLQGVGEAAIVASICPKLMPMANTTTPDPNVGYNPAVEAILEAIGSKLSGKCVPRQLAPDSTTGSVPCAMVEVLPKPEDGQCGECASVPGRSKPNPQVERSVLKQLAEAGRCQDAACSNTCRCQIKQAEGAELTACRQDPNASAPGYCYIDAALQLGNPDLLGGCPNKRGLRFVGEDTPQNGAQTFIACVGAAFADNVTVPD